MDAWRENYHVAFVPTYVEEAAKGVTSPTHNIPDCFCSVGPDEDLPVDITICGADLCVRAADGSVEESLLLVPTCQLRRCAGSLLLQAGVSPEKTRMFKAPDQALDMLEDAVRKAIQHLTRSLLTPVRADIKSCQAQPDKVAKALSKAVEPLTWSHVIHSDAFQPDGHRTFSVRFLVACLASCGRRASSKAWGDSGSVFRKYQAAAPRAPDLPKGRLLELRLYENSACRRVLRTITVRTCAAIALVDTCSNSVWIKERRMTHLFSFATPEMASAWQKLLTQTAFVPIRQPVPAAVHKKDLETYQTGVRLQDEDFGPPLLAQDLHFRSLAGAGGIDVCDVLEEGAQHELSIARQMQGVEGDSVEILTHTYSGNNTVSCADEAASESTSSASSASSSGSSGSSDSAPSDTTNFGSPRDMYSVDLLQTLADTRCM